MHRLFAPFLFIAVMLAVLAPAPGHATDADTKGVKLQFDNAVLQRMSAFVSAFAEVDAQGRWHKIDDASQADPKFLINFGVLHNWMHNAAAFAEADGRASIAAANVAATIGEYFGLEFADHASVPEAGIDFVDGKYVIAANTPKDGPQAVVANVYATPNNELLMVGHVSDKQTTDGAQDDLQVRVAHQQWTGKDCWKLLSWAWAGKPEAKPEAKPVEQPRIESVPEQQAEPEAQPVQDNTPEAQPVQDNTPESAPVVTPEEQAVPESDPATPVEKHETPAVAPEAQPEPPTQPQAQPEPPMQPQAEPVITPEPPTEPEPVVTPEAQPAPEVIPAPQPEAEPVAQTIIPFTATTEPDFSDVLAIAVPAGWNHRNAEGVLELTTEAQDAWLVVEAARLGKRDPQKALKVFSGGAVLTPYGDNGASYVFSSEGSTGPREHMIVVDADANLVCRLTWQAAESHKAAITAILHGLRVNGRAVAG